MIVTGEASGDLHGSNLVRALTKKDPHIRFSGMGGKEMSDAGVELICDADRVSVVGVVEVISRLPDIFSFQAKLAKQLKDEQVDLLIIIDLPDFNLLLAKKAKRLNIPVFYYICPQVWAWRSGRVKTIKERVDSAGVILPFEEDFLKDRGVPAHYVGHPLLDTVRTSLTRKEFDSKYGIAADMCVGLLPGSREREVTSLLPDFLEGARMLQKKIEQPLTFLIPLASTIDRSILDSCNLENYKNDLDIKIIDEHRYDLMKRCSAVVAASGTVSLELALLDTPMVITYRVSPVSYFIGRLLIKIKHFSLVNLIAEKEIVPELLQDEVTPEVICNHLDQLLTGESHLNQMKDGLKQVRDKLGSPGASARAADLALSVLNREEMSG